MKEAVDLGELGRLSPDSTDAAPIRSRKSGILQSDGGKAEWNAARRFRPSPRTPTRVDKTSVSSAWALGSAKHPSFARGAIVRQLRVSREEAISPFRDAWLVFLYGADLWHALYVSATNRFSAIAGSPQM